MFVLVFGAIYYLCKGPEREGGLKNIYMFFYRRGGGHSYVIVYKSECAFSNVECWIFQNKALGKATM